MSYKEDKAQGANSSPTTPLGRFPSTTSVDTTLSLNFSYLPSLDSPTALGTGGTLAPRVEGNPNKIPRISEGEKVATTTTGPGAMLGWLSAVGHGHDIGNPELPGAQAVPPSGGETTKGFWQGRTPVPPLPPPSAPVALLGGVEEQSKADGRVRKRAREEHGAEGGQPPGELDLNCTMVRIGDGAPMEAMGDPMVYGGPWAMAQWGGPRSPHDGEALPCNRSLCAQGGDAAEHGGGATTFGGQAGAGVLDAVAIVAMPLTPPGPVQGWHNPGLEISAASQMLLYKCHFCGKAFAKPQSLGGHMRSHQMRGGGKPSKHPGEVLGREVAAAVSDGPFPVAAAPPPSVLYSQPQPPAAPAGPQSPVTQPGGPEKGLLEEGQGQSEGKDGGKSEVSGQKAPHPQRTIPHPVAAYMIMSPFTGSHLRSYSI